MRQSIAVFLAIVVSATSGIGQSISAAPDEEFVDLQMAARPLPIPPPAEGLKKTKAEFDRDRKMQSAAFLGAATRAHEFYTKYPTHTKAVEARKIEVVSLLRATQTGSVENEPKAMRLAREFRADSSNPSRDRYHVATLVTQMELRKKKLTDRAAMMEEYERRAFDLYGEFPNEPAVYDLFLGIARNSDEERARRMAGQLLRMPAPSVVKQEAQAVLDRLDMPGKRLALEWQDEDGISRKIEDYQGKIVVFYFWASWSGSSEMAHETVKAAMRPGVEVVSVNLDTDLSKGRTAAKKAPSTGSSYFDDRGFGGPLPKQLKAAKVPAVHVIDAGGVYVGSGSPSDLGRLLDKPQN